MASVIDPSQKGSQKISLIWKENKDYEAPDRCLSFYVYLSGPFASLQVFQNSEKDGSFDLQREIKGGFNEWTEARFHLKRGQNETIQLEITTAENSEGQHGTFALDNMSNLPYTEECTNLSPNAAIKPTKTATEVPTEPPDRNYHHFFYLNCFFMGVTIAFLPYNTLGDK